MDGGVRPERLLGMGRKLVAGDLELLILALLAERPRHGYEIIRSLEDRSRGFYVPSPGMVYPALTRLKETGCATVDVDGLRKRYRLTAGGLAHLEANRAATEVLLHQFERVGRRMERVRTVLRGEDAGTAVALPQARHSLDEALAAKAGSPAAEQERVAAILERAAAEIRGGSS